ncbi:galanin receptor type 1-like [Arapaima gigas]
MRKSAEGKGTDCGCVFTAPETISENNSGRFSCALHLHLTDKCRRCNKSGGYAVRRYERQAVYLSSTTTTSASQKTDFAKASGTCGDVAFNMISNVAVVADMLAGLVCNSATVWLLTCGKGGLATSDLFLFNSAFSELLICPCIFLALLQHLNVGIGFFLPVLNFCFSFILAARPFFRGCICVDRYLAVVHPIAYLKYRPLKYRLPCLAVVWLIVIGYCILNNFTNSTLVLGLIFMVVLGVDSFCSLSILRVLKRPRPGDAEQEDMNVMKQRAFRTVLVIQATMVMNYVPMLLFTLFKNLLATPDDTCQFFTVAFTLLVLGSFVDPLIYLSRAGKLLCVKRTTEN